MAILMCSFSLSPRLCAPYLYLMFYPRPSRSFFVQLSINLFMARNCRVYHVATPLIHHLLLLYFPYFYPLCLPLFCSLFILAFSHSL